MRYLDSCGCKVSRVSVESGRWRDRGAGTGTAEAFEEATGFIHPPHQAFWPLFDLLPVEVEPTDAAVAVRQC
jgi:hypothetical protein